MTTYDDMVKMVEASGIRLAVILKLSLFCLNDIVHVPKKPASPKNDPNHLVAGGSKRAMDWPMVDSKTGEAHGHITNISYK